MCGHVRVQADNIASQRCHRACKYVSEDCTRPHTSWKACKCCIPPEDTDIWPPPPPPPYPPFCGNHKHKRRLVRFVRSFVIHTLNMPGKTSWNNIAVWYAMNKDLRLREDSGHKRHQDHLDILLLYYSRLPLLLHSCLRHFLRENRRTS